MDIDLLKRNFFNRAIGDIYRALEGKSITGAFILTFCLIDYLTWIEFGEMKYGYNQWIEKRLLPLNIYYTNKAEELYSVRCGLVHCYGPSKQIINNKFLGYILKYCDPGFHLQSINDRRLRVCLYSLITDCVYAAHLIFEEFKVNISKDQEMRLAQQINNSQELPPDLYAEMHPALAIFDDTSKLNLNLVRSGYSMNILWK